MTALRSSRKDYRQVNEIKIRFGIRTRKKPLLLQANWPRCKRRKNWWKNRSCDIASCRQVLSELQTEFGDIRVLAGKVVKPNQSTQNWRGKKFWSRFSIALSFVPQSGHRIDLQRSLR